MVQKNHKTDELDIEIGEDSRYLTISSMQGLDIEIGEDSICYFFNAGSIYWIEEAPIKINHPLHLD